jgi:hypothetical protein
MPPVAARSRRAKALRPDKRNRQPNIATEFRIANPKWNSSCPSQSRTDSMPGATTRPEARALSRRRRAAIVRIRASCDRPKEPTASDYDAAGNDLRLRRLRRRLTMQ